MLVDNWHLLLGSAVITGKPFRWLLHGPLVYVSQRVRLNRGLLQGWADRCLLFWTSAERERETVVFSNADTNRIGDDILLGWSGLSWSEGEEEGRAGGCGAESVSTVIGKGCLWLVIYILVLVDGICRGYVYSYTAWLTVYCCKNCLNNRESQKTLSSHEKINTTAVTVSIKTLES